MKTLKRTALCFLIAIVSQIVFTGCHTAHGFGEDMEGCRPLHPGQNRQIFSTALERTAPKFSASFFFFHEANSPWRTHARMRSFP